MNYVLILKLIGNMLRVEAAFMLFPFLVSLVYRGEDRMAFVYAILILVVCGTLLAQWKPKDTKFRSKDAFAAAALAWLLFSIFGALPFFFSGCFDGFIDCVFEAISGFTTTGASILTAVEGLPKGIVFWRSFSHWIGGMGVLVFMLAVMPSMNPSSVNLLRAESTGLAPNRIVPKIRETARIMYLIYLGMTVLLIILLIASGLPLYDSLIHAFSTAGTGGFSNMNASVAAYNNVVAEVIMTVFMFLFGVSFTLYFYLLKGDWKQVVRDDELRFFFWIVLAAIAIIAIDITGIYGSALEALRHSSFQVSTIISTTGFATTDFNLWPDLSRFILVLLMVTGCCAGSTGGGLKLVRVLLLFKALKLEVSRIIHPRSVKVLMINGKKIGNEMVTRVALFCFAYFILFTVSVLLISIEKTDLLTSTTAVISMLSNIGPGLGAVGPVSNYASFSPLSKIVLSFCMLAGRLEFLPVLVLFQPSIWKREV